MLNSIIITPCIEGLIPSHKEVNFLTLYLSSFFRTLFSKNSGVIKIASSQAVIISLDIANLELLLKKSHPVFP